MKNILIKFVPIYRYITIKFDNIVKRFYKPKNKISEKKQVALVTDMGVGDAMNFLCIADKYLKIFPKDKFEITLFCSKSTYKLLKGETNFDKYILMDYFIFSKINIKSCLNIPKRIKIIKMLREKKYDILIAQPHTLSILPSDIYTSNIIIADKKITIKNDAILQVPKKYIYKVYTDVGEINNSKIHNTQMYNKLAMYASKHLFDMGGVNLLDEEIKFKKIHDVKLNIKLPKEYYVVFPSSSSDKKNWEFDKYVELIRRIYDKIELPVVFLGTKSDEEVISKICEKLDKKIYINLIDKTEIFEYIQIIKNSRFVITNDTSAYHIAVVEEVPVTIIVGGYTYDFAVKYDFAEGYKKPYICVNKNDCFNCKLQCIHGFDTKKFPCLSSISVDDAWKVVNKMIENEYIKRKKEKNNGKNNQ